jgi:hypothetical protein
VVGAPAPQQGEAMSKADRERRHQANLERIHRVQLVVGLGDRLRVDHEGTLFERARLMGEEIRSHEATERGLAAFDRLLRIAEDRDAHHQRDVVSFLTAVWNNRSLPLMTLRGLDQDVGDDMVAVLDAFRYARMNLAEQVQGGAARVGRVLGRTSVARA